MVYKESPDLMGTRLWGCSVDCCSSITKFCPTLRPMDCSTLCFPVLHHLPEFDQTHVH